ncbi:putative NADPH-quinone reductase [Bacillus sp. TS-2]|nr:putative NADPH-quinone reductase [Bacillus sp. TS-2]
MKNLLLINGHDEYERAQGGLNKRLSNEIKKVVSDEFTIMTSDVISGYEVSEEINKFKSADVVMIQAPIYWFSLPGILKKYIDDVFIPDVFFGKAKSFGKGGLFKNKKYMLSITWGAQSSVFNNERNTFLEGLSEEQVLFPIHKTFEYCGFQQLPTFSVYSSMRLETVSPSLERLQKHIQSHVLANR